MIHSRHAHSFDKIIKWKQEVDEQCKQLIEGQTDGKQSQIKHVRHPADTPGVTQAVTQLGEQVECPYYNTPLGTETLLKTVTLGSWLKMSRQGRASSSWVSFSSPCWAPD